jgi:hypothetical protein
VTPSGFRYATEGTLVAGDLHLLCLASPAATPATPTPSFVGAAWRGRDRCGDALLPPPDQIGKSA